MTSSSSTLNSLESFFGSLTAEITSLIARLERPDTKGNQRIINLLLNITKPLFISPDVSNVISTTEGKIEEAQEMVQQEIAKVSKMGYSHLSDTEAPIIQTNSKAPETPTVFLARLLSFRQQKNTMIVIKELTKP